MLSYYSDLNLKNITSKKYRHLFLLLFWPVYLLLFILTEKYIVPVYNIYCPLDDYIPFCEFFVVPYVLWYALLAFVSLYTLFFDIPSFKKFCSFLSITCLITFSLYMVFPNMQNLRPEEFARDNIFVDIMKNLYAIDTNTNVCPSIHVIFSLGMMFALWNSRHFSTIFWRIISITLTTSICLATVFLKQHSIIDVITGVALSFIVLPFIFKKEKSLNKKVLLKL